jgi:hypothetical protein
MGHVWDQLVIGGIGQPRMLLLDDNMCQNPFFNIDTTGYTPSSGVTLSRSGSADAFAEYMGKIQYTDGGTGYVDYEFNTGVAIANRQFFAFLRIKTTKDCQVALMSKGAGRYMSINVLAGSDEVKSYYFVGTGFNESSSTIVLRILNYNNNEMSIYFDKVFIGEVKNDYTFPQPNKSYMVFERDVLGENRLWDGRMQRFNAKYIPNYFCDWQCLDASYETYRQRMALNKTVFCIPHNDVSWGFFGTIMDDVERRYAFDRFFGHESSLAIKGSGFIYELPEVQSGSGTLYFEDYIL